MAPRTPDQGPVRQAVFTALSGQAGDVSGKVDGPLLDMLRSVGGQSKRTQSGIDLTAAAAKLGLSRRSVERWVRSDLKPSADHAMLLAKKSKQAATTQAGRREATAERRVAATAARRVRVSITGMQGPNIPAKFRNQDHRDRGYIRLRTTQMVLTPEDAQAMYDAYERAGHKGFMDWAQQHWGANYLEDWSFLEVKDVRLDGHDGRSWYGL